MALVVEWRGTAAARCDDQLQGDHREISNSQNEDVDVYHAVRCYADSLCIAESRSQFTALQRGMPRVKQRQRIVFCDCRDCVDVNQGPLDYSWEAAARQLPPPRSLVLLLEGFNADASIAGTCCRVDEVDLPHFDNVARKGVGFCVAVPTGVLLSTAALAYTPRKCCRSINTYNI